jgi:hypothetical protein
MVPIFPAFDPPGRGHKPERNLGFFKIGRSVKFVQVFIHITGKRSSSEVNMRANGMV